jgi:large subunit ribosomal protein L10
VNKEQKAAVVEEVAAQIQESEAVLAVDYRGISVPQAAQLRERLTEAGARFRVVKNTLTLRAAEQAGAEDLKELLEGPTAFAFVAAEGGDVALTAKAISQFSRANAVLEFKGGRMGGEPLTLDQIQQLATLPPRDALHGQLVGVVAAPITGLVRGLNALIAGLAIQLRQIAEEGMVPRGEGAAETAPAPAPEEAAAEEAAPPPSDDAAEAAPADEAPPAEDAAADDDQQTDEAPSEGEEDKEG